MQQLSWLTIVVFSNNNSDKKKKDKYTWTTWVHCASSDVFNKKTNVNKQKKFKNMYVCARAWVHICILSQQIGKQTNNVTSSCCA